MTQDTIQTETVQMKAAGKRLVVFEIPVTVGPCGPLIIPAGSLGNATFEARVVAVGTEVDCSIIAGDRVVLPHDVGLPFKVDGIEYLSIVENQILAAYGD